MKLHHVNLLLTTASSTQQRWERGKKTTEAISCCLLTMHSDVAQLSNESSNRIHFLKRCKMRIKTAASQVSNTPQTPPDGQSSADPARRHACHDIWIAQLSHAFMRRLVNYGSVECLCITCFFSPTNCYCILASIACLCVGFD